MPFSKTYRFTFNWNNHLLAIGSIGTHNKDQISHSLKDMSSESIRNRFLGSKREFTSQELNYLTALDGWNHYAIGIEEVENKKRGVGVIRLVRSSENTNEGEVAIALIDDYQKQGLGKVLLNLIILAALERNIFHLSFTFLPQNEGIQRLIRSVGTPVRQTLTRDFAQLILDLKTIDLEKLKSELKATVPNFEKTN